MSDFFNKIIKMLIAGKVESPRLEARLLLAAVLQCKADEINADMFLNEEQQLKVIALVNQRLQHKPLDKILGHREFYKSDFVVNEDVLSPRPDTEILVEEALRYLPHTAESILDLGTGSGCIIASILLEKPQMHGTAADISTRSLKIARQNVENLQLMQRIDFIEADWFAADFVAKIGQKFDMIVSNPPYIPSADIEKLAPEVKIFDPMQALDGGKSGFESYARIAEVAPDLLKDGGYILLEAGYGQARKIADIFTAHGLKLIAIVADLNGIERCVILQKQVAEIK